MSLYLGIDIGGTNTELGVVNERGQVVSSQTLSTTRYGADYESYITALTDLIKQISASPDLEGEVVGIGVGAPNANYFSGCVEQAVNLPWTKTTPIVADLEARTGLPVVLDNDANASALGEHSYGVARGLDHFVEITLGTGVGSGIYADGRLIRGYQGKAGELGHMAVGEPDQLCGCGRYGCLEASVAAPAVARRAVSLKKLCLEQGMWSELCDIPDEELTSKVVAEVALATGDSLARQVFEETGEVLGRALAQFACFSAPQAFILFGGVARCGDLLLQPVRKAFNKAVLHIYRGSIDILLSSLPKGQAAVLGAASLARERNLPYESTRDLRLLSTLWR